MKVQANEFRGKSKVIEHVGKLERFPKFQRSKTGPDVLFDADYNHEGGQTCDGCTADRYKDLEPRDEEVVVSHYGTIVLMDGVGFGVRGQGVVWHLGHPRAVDPWDRWRLTIACLLSSRTCRIARICLDGV